MFDWSHWDKNFGQSSNIPFGSSTPSYFTSSAPAFGDSRFAMGASSSTAFGSPSSSSFAWSSLSEQMPTPKFGSTGTSIFAGSTPACGFGGAVRAPSTPAFGTSLSSFCGSSMTAQNPTSGGFGWTPHKNPNGNPSQQTQQASGRNIFGSKPSYQAFSQPASSSASNKWSFAPTSSPTSTFCGFFRIDLKCATCGGFGWVPQITQPAFGRNLFSSTQPFGGSSQPAFGVSNPPPFGGPTSSPTFGSSTAAFGSIGTDFGLSSASTFGAANSHVFGPSNTSAFVSSSVPSFSFSSFPAFGTVESKPFGSSPSLYQAQSSPSGGSSASAAAAAPAPSLC